MEYAWPPHTPSTEAIDAPGGLSANGIQGARHTIAQYCFIQNIYIYIPGSSSSTTMATFIYMEREAGSKGPFLTLFTSNQPKTMIKSSVVVESIFNGVIHQ
ncbi:hypothetical protein Dimus_011448 [Dionaea muscipula]